MTEPVENNFIFLIDTENYSGDFERPMCAYITGCVGECLVGVEEAQQFADDHNLSMGQYGYIKENPFEGLVRSKPDDHGCNRPVTIWVTPNWYNTGRGMHYKNTDDESIALEEYRNSVITQTTSLIERIKSFQTEEDTPENRERGAWTAEAKKRDIERCKKEIERANGLKEVNKYPAYQSVAIFLSKSPCLDTLLKMKKRAYKYAEDNKVTITGFRLLEVIPESYREVHI